jgi:8-oxo-dGTP pyrophosphatase MutT (NUDIX family)
MKSEISAGGLILRNTPNGWEILRIRDRSGAWTFPKGKIEDGETLEETAVREISEEVGLHQLTFLGTLTPLHYIYTRNGQVDKTVHYFVFEYTGTAEPVGQKEEGIQEPTWVLLDTAHVDIGYPDSNNPLIIETRKIVAEL